MLRARMVYEPRASATASASNFRHWLDLLELQLQLQHAIWQPVSGEESAQISLNQLSRSSQTLTTNREPSGSEAPPLPSKGSARHALGTCTECRFMKLPNGCRNGAACPFCHFPHEAPSKVHRPSKGIRAGYKRSVMQIAESDLSEAEKLEAYKKMAVRSPYTRRLLKAVVPNIDELIKDEELEPRAPGLQRPETKPKAKISL